MVPRESKKGFYNSLSWHALLISLSGGLLLPSDNQASAEDLSVGNDKKYPLEEIIVTAARTGASNLQETAIAITALTSDLLKQAAISNLRDVGAIVPGLQVTSNTDFAQIYLRGVGSNNIFAGTEASVGLHQDGVYIARPSAMLGEFLDVERIEVLRGPQGTLYGRNSAGGTLNIISRRPNTEEVTAEARAGYGNYNLFTAAGYINGPISNGKLAGALSVLYLKHDGYRKNLVKSGNDIDSKDSFSVRGQILWDVSSNLSVLFRADFAHERGATYGYHTFVEPVPAPALIANANAGYFDRVTLNFPHRRERDNFGGSLQLEWQISDDWFLTSLAAYRDNYYLAQVDSDATELDLLRVFLVENQNQFSEEITVSGGFRGFDLLFGAYYFTEEIDADGTQLGLVSLGIARTPGPLVKTEAIAVFANIQYPFSERLSGEFGIRYSHDKKEFDKVDGLSILNRDGTIGVQVTNLTFPRQSRIDSVVTPKFGLNYKYSEDIFLYAVATRGFKGGGFNFTAAAMGSFKPEFIWAYEIGVKASLLDNTFILNTSAFSYDYRNLQVQAFIMPGTVDITNAASASIHGIEIETRYAVNQAFELSGQVSYLSASYDDYPGATVSGGGEINASGNWLNSAPKWSGNVGLNYQKEVGTGLLYSRLSVSWTSRIFFTADNNFVDAQASYALVDMSISYRWAEAKYEIGLWGRNILDKQYVTSTASFPAARAGRAGDPATIGLQFAIHY